MKQYNYQNNLIGKKQLRQLLAWSFTNYDSMQACALADELKYLGFKYASQAGISISIEDLKIPFVKNLMLEKANQEIINSEKIYLKGKITDVERFQKIIDTWSLTSESLKEQVIHYFKNYDPLNSVYIMAFSGARGNLSQVRQLVGMRGLMSDPSGEIMKLPIKKNFREGLTITDYLMSGYGARKGIVDTALKTANSGYLTRRLIDVGQDILIREKDCLTPHSFLLKIDRTNSKSADLMNEKLLGRVLNKPIFNLDSNQLIVDKNIQITPQLINKFHEYKIENFYIRSPLTCNLYRAICQKCYGWDLANENLVDIGEAVGILAGQSIGEPGTQLTMRTFHTGGIFTSDARQQVISPVNGIIKFYKGLKTVLLRTNRGEDVLLTKNSGSILLIPESKKDDLIQIEILRNTILFPKNNQYITKGTVIGELVNTNKQIKTELKPIVSNGSGEIFMPRLKKKVNLTTSNKLVWILSGQLYNSPNNSFINFYPDYKLNKNSYIFRTKILNHYLGSVRFINDEKSLYQRQIRLENIKYSFKNTKLIKISDSNLTKQYLLKFPTSQYLLNINSRKNQLFLKLTRNNQFGVLLTNTFRTLTGGTLFYDRKQVLNLNKKNKTIKYIKSTLTSKKYYSFSSHKTMTWLSEEIHKLNCEPNILLVEHGDFISRGLEIIPGLFSKTSGIVTTKQKNSLIHSISIKTGSVYQGKNIKSVSGKLYYPGEIIFQNITIKTLSFCEQGLGKNTDQLLIRPVDIYEMPNKSIKIDHYSSPFLENTSSLFNSKVAYTYKSNQKIKGKKSLNLVENSLIIQENYFLKNETNIELRSHKKEQKIDFFLSEKLFLNNFIVPNLRYKYLSSCFLLQANQFIDQYTVIGYLESVIRNSLEIVKFKIKTKETKQLLLISNEDCVTIPKLKFPKKKLNDFIINSNSVNDIGRIIIENDNLLTIQKGRPYFFPNCKTDILINKTNLEYKILAPNRVIESFSTKRQVFVNYYNTIKLSLNRAYSKQEFSTDKIKISAEFSKIFFKKNGKLYSSIIPQFSKRLSVINSNQDRKYQTIIKPTVINSRSFGKPNRTLLLQSNDLTKNKYTDITTSDYQLTLIEFVEQSFTKSTKAIGLYAITDDYLEQEVNSVFCKNSEFIEVGETIGLLNLEKEITGDIVQGLPRIEEILEARKRNLTTKRLPTSQKKGLLFQKTSLDPNFEFRKLGTQVKESEKINPHKLLKVYFNYYGLMKLFICDQKLEIRVNRLLKNYEGSYKSFKKVQLFILNSVQSVYQSQGVTINDKHLEVIIKQMTTKVLITYEGNTPLLRREVIDLYHIQYINKIIESQGKQPAFYVPLLLGITKAALNNPSFISAASFQETTRVLTKAAIEGRIDWLRGLKENIIIGHLIPAGTGSQNYKTSFQQKTLVRSR